MATPGPHAAAAIATSILLNILAWRAIAAGTGTATVLGGRIVDDEGYASPQTAAAASAPAAAPAPGTETSDPAPTPAPALKAAACAQLIRRVEQQLAAAQRCQANDACIVESFEYAFRPCGLSVRQGASLDQARADAKRYQDRCHPVIRPVKCAYLPRATCDHARCILAPYVPG